MDSSKSQASLKRALDAALKRAREAEAALVREREAASRQQGLLIAELEEHRRLSAENTRLLLELTPTAPEQDIRRDLARHLRRITNAAAVVFNDYDAQRRCLVVRGVDLERGLILEAVRVLGRRIEDIESPIEDATYAKMLATIVGHGKSITEMSFGAVPRPVGILVNRLLGIGHFVGLAHIVDGKLFGTSAIAFKKGQSWPPDPCLESLAHTIAICLRRRVAEERLRSSEQRFQSLFDSLVDAVLVADAETGMLLDANPAALRLCGHSREALLAMHQSQLHPPALSEEVQRLFAVARGGESVSSAVRHANGHDIPVEIKSSVNAQLGGRPCVIGVFRDISERMAAEAQRQQLEEQLRAAQKMDAIGSLAGGVAHDFNNLLSVILSYTSFASEGLPEGSPIRDDLGEVKKAAERAAALTKQLLAFGRRQVMKPEPVNLNRSIRELENMLRRILSEDIELVLELGAELGDILADPGQMGQVLMNLVANARDALPNGGKLSIETRNVHVDEELASAHVELRAGQFVQLTVSDNGVGMDEQTRSKLFEPFFSTKEQGKGTGLGLSVVYGIVKQSGGDIWVDSELGEGTSVKLLLPRQLQLEETAGPGHSAPALQKGHETILVVEDEPAMRKAVVRSLERAGYAVLSAANGAEALQTLSQHSGELHLLLTDVVMPGMNGRALAREALQQRPGLAVVYMSGYSDDAIEHHGVLDEGAFFLSKPFLVPELLQKVREALGE